MKEMYGIFSLCINVNTCRKKIIKQGNSMELIRVVQSLSKRTCNNNMAILLVILCRLFALSNWHAPFYSVIYFQSILAKMEQTYQEVRDRVIIVNQIIGNYLYWQV